MYLKSIEIQGFKSFANRTLFEFHNGITCIVGPNGSGKSNVADAVRWVLGEQSAKQLRGSSMQDVIFAGTQQRKPQSFASVSITFDNSDHRLAADYDEVTVTRRVYRSGESEYLINKAPVRLKDVNELFFDTGIGREGYSIIGQGRVEQILMGHPDELRSLLDEAAGIQKYRHRKQEAVKHLENEQANLARVSDILSELERRVGPLEEQANTAKTYLSLHDGLRRAEVNAFVLERKKNENEVTKISDSLSQAQGQRESQQQELQQLEERYSAKQDRMNRLAAEIEKDRESLTALGDSGREMERRAAELTEKIHTGDLQAAHAREKAESSSKKLDETRKEIDGNESRRQEINRQIYDARQKRDTAASRSEELGRQIEKESDRAKNSSAEVLELMNRGKEIAADLEKYRTTLEHYRVRKAEIDRKLLENRQQEEETQKTRDADDLARQEADGARAKAESELAAGESELSAGRKKLDEARNSVSSGRANAKILQARIDSLRNMAESYEGYSFGTKKVMEARTRFPGILGTVADLVHTEKRYETAIETALGGAVQNIVTDTRQTAKDLIGYLKKNRFGRTTFLPVDGITVRHSFGYPDALKENGVLGTADTLVTADARYRTIVLSLLGNTVIADTIENAMKLSAKYRSAFRIVTLEGDVMNPGGSMTGGAFRSNANLLGRNRQIRELTEQSRKDQAALAAAEKDLASAEKKVSELESRVPVLRRASSEAGIAASRAQIVLEHDDEKLKSIREEKNAALSEQAALAASVREARDRQSGLEEKARDIESRRADTEQNSTDSLGSAEKLREERRKLDEEVRRQDVLLAQLSQSARDLAETIEKSRKDAAALENEARDAAGEQEARERDSEGFRKELEKLEKDREDGRKSEEELSGRIRDKEADRQSISDSLQGFFSESGKMSGQIQLLDREILRLESSKQRLEDSLDSQTARLFDEYGINPGEAEKQFQEDGMTDPERRKHIRAIREQIRALGPVNVGAVDEYKEVSERYQFLHNQVQDLTKSRDALLKVIDELDTGMRLQFSEKFGQIREEFDRVFRELFGGGHAALNLVEGEDILDAGIIVSAEPPGKKLQNMLQLSGGEKALTAIALLFAIQSLKPSPFCLLDEIEAALDDSNVGRYAAYLKKLSADTQFIVITHRRGTMAAADRLYGVTMQEKGVSALVSVSLVENDLT
ncbi:MAG: chromosome segregation protein SMC [Lachnospiraceae bacterium]|jgi:chromosome segregation protein